MAVRVALQHHLGTVAKRFYSTRGAMHSLRNASSWMLITLPSKKWVSASVSKNIKQADEHSLKEKGLILAPQPKSRQRDEDIQLDKVGQEKKLPLKALSNIAQDLSIKKLSIKARSLSAEMATSPRRWIFEISSVKEDSSRTWHL
ncbi:hypothetical protein SELMODRAFT_406490 [Selaginella moellendorffii]|uniref:Uncharacterized protein n=1 Tax=Selaginella moellendorffii TaxID=88036 RepID=D8R2J0_SELML|nr:hypothetical protein SELMODRAFT_406490 [Selaginella moellendorffii]